MLKLLLFIFFLIPIGAIALDNASTPSLSKDKQRLGRSCVKNEFKSNLVKAKYVLAARLEEYLPNNKGRYRVLINFRGAYQPGDFIVTTARPYEKHVGNSVTGHGTKIGAAIIIMGEQFFAENDAFIIVPYECNGVHSASGDTLISIAEYVISEGAD